MNPAAEVSEMIAAGFSFEWVSARAGVSEKEIQLLVEGVLTDPKLSVAQKIHDLYRIFVEIRDVLE